MGNCPDEQIPSLLGQPLFQAIVFAVSHVLYGSSVPRQLSLGEVIGKKKGKAQPKPRPVSPGRPRREVDVELLRQLRDKGYGFKRTATEFTQATGEYISHTTARERVLHQD